MDIVGVDKEHSNNLRRRQCGRCRQMFEGDPTLHRTALPEWWACPPCRTALLGPDRNTTATPNARS
jgi:hypothetical protein